MYIFLGIICAIIIGYLLGSISNGVIIGKLFFHVDVREKGSHNSGGTNTGRVLGKKVGILVIFLDVLKTMIAIWLVYFVSSISNIQETLKFSPSYLAYIAGFSACLGHTFPCFFHFRGGKSVACLGGICLATNWILSLIGITIFIVVMLISKYVSLGSIVTSISLIILSFIPFTPFGMNFNMQSDFYYSLLFIVVAILLILRHRSNIARIIKGEENKIHFSKKKQ